MRALALITALLVAAPAMASPRARCASCSLLTAGATGSDLTLSGTLAAQTVNATSAMNITGGGALTTSGNGTSGITFSCGNSSGDQCHIRNAIGAAGATSLVPAFYFHQYNGALGANDLLAAFFDNAVLKWSLDAEGDMTVQGVASLTSSVGTPASGTGITAVYSGAIRRWVHKVTVTNAALTAAATTDITLHLTPVNSRIERVIAEVTQVFTGGALSSVAVTCGNSAGGNQYLLTHSEFSATGAFGDVVGEMGAGVVSATLADMGAVASGVPGAITVQCRFTCGGANCSAATQGSTTFIVEGATY